MAVFGSPEAAFLRIWSSAFIRWYFSMALKVRSKSTSYLSDSGSRSLLNEMKLSPDLLTATATSPVSWNLNRKSESTGSENSTPYMALIVFLASKFVHRASFIPRWKSSSVRLSVERSPRERPKLSSTGPMSSPSETLLTISSFAASFTALSLGQDIFRFSYPRAPLRVEHALLRLEEAAPAGEVQCGDCRYKIGKGGDPLRRDEAHIRPRSHSHRPSKRQIGILRSHGKSRPREIDDRRREPSLARGEHGRSLDGLLRHLWGAKSVILTRRSGSPRLRALSSILRLRYRLVCIHDPTDQ